MAEPKVHLLRPQPGRRADQSAFLLILGNLMKILGSFFRGPDRSACACVSNKPFVCLCLRVQSVFEVCCLSGDSEACPRAGDVLDAPPHHQVPETAPAPAPRRRTPATLPVRLSKSWSLTSNGADSIRWGRRPPEPRSLCPSCRLLPGLPRNPGSPRSVTRSLEPITVWPPTVPRHPTWPRGFD